MAKGPYTSNLLTRRDVERVFQLSPEPPAMAALNGYILAAKSTGDNNFFSYFLHHYEKQLNSRVYSFLQSDSSDQYDPECFLDLNQYFCEKHSGSSIRFASRSSLFIRISFAFPCAAILPSERRITF